MIRVLYVSTSSTLGGAEKTLFTLASRLDRKRFEVAGVISLKPEGEYARRLRASGARVESLESKRMSFGDSRRLAKLIERDRPDLLHAFMYQSIQLCRLAKPRVSYPLKLISSPRVNYRSRSWPTRLIDRALRSRDDLLVTECEASGRYLVEQQGYEPSKIEVILNGVDQPTVPGEREARRREIGLTNENILVGAVGRLDRQKGLSVLIKSFSRLPNRALRCVILGEGAQRSHLELLIRQHGLAQRVHLLGERHNMGDWLSAFDIYCLPSLWEGLPNALLEAMAAGLPVVASAVDGVPEAVADGKDGLLVPPDQPEALAQALSSLAADPARRSAFGAAARAAVAARFTVARMLSDYEAAYARIAR